jgi:hypothetical protein
VQAIGWILLSRTAVANGLTIDERSTATIRESGKNGYGAFVLYALLAVTAFWFPVIVAIVTTVSWLFWLVLSIRLKRV